MALTRRAVVAGRCVVTVALVTAALMVTVAGCRRTEPEPPRPEGTQMSKIKKVREPAVVGLFYPQEPEALGQMIDAFLSDAPAVQIKNLRGLICPHAGYRYSGPTAAHGFKQLAGRDVETVVVMAPSHYAAFHGASIPDVQAYRTPLGLVEVSEKAPALAKVPPFACCPPCQVSRPPWHVQSPKKAPPAGEETPHTWEHSLEVEIPFLQRVLKGFRILPVVFGQVDAEKAAEALADYVDEKTVLVVSSDLSHYHPYDEARSLDKSCVDAICRLDVKGMRAQEACGKGPILALMHLAIRNGWKARLLDYRNSGDTSGDKSGVVGYAAIAFVEAEAAATEPGSLSQEERQTLLTLARSTLREVVDGRPIPKADRRELPKGLTENKGCFVTLTKGGRLRGCIGYIFPQGPLYEAVMQNAYNAAMRDGRFPPVERDELDAIRIEISVLTVPQRLEFTSPEDLLAKLRPHVDGVVLNVGRRQSTFLPQVWEQLPEKESFLNHLSQKAGLPAGAWRQPGTTVLTYQVEAFSEPEM